MDAKERNDMLLAQAQQRLGKRKAKGRVIPIKVLPKVFEPALKPLVADKDYKTLPDVFVSCL
jgi:hypothetical protein